MLRLILSALAALTSTVTGVPPASPARVIFQPVFPNVAGVVTNEFAYWNKNLPTAKTSADWEMTSGTLYTAAGELTGVASTGEIDAGPDNATTSKHTNSAVFRLNTRRADFGNVNVRFKLNIEQLSSTPVTPPVAWDGVHIWLRYQSQYSLYYASVARRDGKVVIKKKCPGGPSNSGTYHTLGGEKAGHPARPNTWAYVSATVKNNANGTVTINLYRDDKLVHSATDSGTGCAPITKAGATGIRGDNARFRFHTFQVRDA